jgi:hypothetical protein
MDWTIIDYECLIDKDDYSIINISIKNIIVNKKENIYLESVNTFLKDLKKSFKTKKCLIRQIKVDFPREKCYINNIQIKNYKDFLKEIKYTNLFKEAALICTQSSMYPVTLKLYEKFTDEKNNIHLSDFRDDNPLIFNFKVIDKKHMIVEFEKKFQIIEIKKGDPFIIKTLKVNTTVEIDDKDKDVFYTVSDISKFKKKMIKYP